MNTCCELGTRPYSENKLVNKKNTIFLLSRHTVTASPMDPPPSPCSSCLSGADAHSISLALTLPDSRPGPTSEQYWWEVGGPEKRGSSLCSFCYLPSVVPTSSKWPLSTGSHRRPWSHEHFLCMFSGLIWSSWMLGSHSTTFSFCSSTFQSPLVPWLALFVFLALPRSL